MEALILARGTSGACRVTHITGSGHSPQLEECLLSPCSRSLHSLLEAITAGKIDARGWGQATMPLRMGGLGLRDPLTEGPSMRLATILSSKALALQLGAVPEYVDLQTSAAFTTYQRVLGGCPVAIDVRDKYLQKTLTDNLLQK